VELRFGEAEALRTLAAVPRGLDEPVGDPAALTTYLLAAVARERGVKVVLSGEGADELFGGYDYYDGVGARGVQTALGGAARVARRLRRLAWRLLSAGTGGVPASPLFTGVPGETASGFPIVASPAERRRLLGTPPGAPSAWEARIAARAATMRDPLRRRRYVDMKTWLPDDLLVKLDRMTMGCGVEGRAPYLDADLVELAFALPARLLRRPGEAKSLLRRAFAGGLPPAIVGRRKQGFVLPLSAWIRGPLRAEFEAVLGARQADGLDEREASALLDDHVSGRADRARLLYTLYAYRAWFAAVRGAAARACAGL
jgi:asparagine synthase (glutamine-hydrolysing)